MTTVYDCAVGITCGINVCGSDKKARDFLDGALSGGETDADKTILDFGFRISDFGLGELSLILWVCAILSTNSGIRIPNSTIRNPKSEIPRQLFQSLDRQGQVRTTLISDNRMNLIENHCACGFEHSSSTLAR